MSKKKRPQTPKSRNFALAMAMQDKRRGSATTPVDSGSIYKRPKAGARGRDW